MTSFEYNLISYDYPYYISVTWNCSYHRAAESLSGRPQVVRISSSFIHTGPEHESGAESTPFLPVHTWLQSYQDNTPALGHIFKTQLGNSAIWWHVLTFTCFLAGGDEEYIYMNKVVVNKDNKGGNLLHTLNCIFPPYLNFSLSLYLSSFLCL